MFDFEEILERFKEFLFANLPGVIGAILVLIIGFKVSKWIVKIIDKSMNKYNKDVTLNSFIKAVAGFTLKFIVIITAALVLGIPIDTFLVVLGAAGLAIAFALKDNLSNLAGGVIILIFRPFNIGDFIEATGNMGTVKEIQLLYTKINTPDNKAIVIPNGALVSGNVTNFSAEETRRVDLKFGVGYEADIKKVKEILNSIANNHPLVFEDPEPFIKLFEHGDSAIIFTVRVWCQTADYWTIYYDLQEEVKLKFDENNINIPFPQMDVHLFNKNGGQK
ncbi:mechanosensitive ion channel [Herbivorax sp. ANBcel31]|uniref:mechanosensitive ion channel family protein n=1 Tax=Herbivorax sp. ANBcel31 TaxID=3069754 RepID=UPI0027B5E92A|nr:mechanosensitive ion channel domain-containing protein [Herbivorax sp. ANBcel31]MDQ2087469.1 mechanosensitive ion channel [Herbivorax sp. ANBcel31]